MTHCSKSIHFDIQGLTRLNEDGCTKIENDKSRTEICKRQINDYQYCPGIPKNVEDVSLQNHKIYYRDGYGVNPELIQKESNFFKASRNLTNPRVINQLYERTPGSGPNRSRGPGNIIDETILVPGDSTFQNTPCNNLAGITIDRFIPQVTCIPSVQHPDNIIPENSDPAWKRGGQDTRQIIRNHNYKVKCGL